MVVFSGELRKKGDHLHQWHRRWFEFHEDGSLRYAKSKSEPKQLINTDGARAKAVGGSKTRFNVTFSTEKRKAIHLEAPNEADCMQWMALINREIRGDEQTSPQGGTLDVKERLAEETLKPRDVVEASAPPLPDNFVVHTRDTSTAAKATEKYIRMDEPIDLKEGPTPFELLDAPPTCFSHIKFMFSILVLPAKFLVLFTCLFIAWIWCKIFTLFAKIPTKAGDPPLPAWRVAGIKFFASTMGRWMLFVFGFYWIKRKRLGPPRKKSEKPAPIIVCNHLGYVDILACMVYYVPSFVSKLDVLYIPFVGSIAGALQCAFVDRNSKTSRKDVTELIKSRADSPKGYPPLLIFPEGTTTNGSAIMKFQPGAFRAGCPIQPVVIRCPFKSFNPCWAELHGGIHLFRMMLQFVNHMEMIELPIYYPDSAEKADATLFASNVRNVMAEASGIPTSDIDYYRDFIRQKVTEEIDTEAQQPRRSRARTHSRSNSVFMQPRKTLDSMNEMLPHLDENLEKRLDAIVAMSSSASEGETEGEFIRRHTSFAGMVAP